MQDLIETACKKEAAGLQERRGVIPKVRSDLAWKLVEERRKQVSQLTLSTPSPKPSTPNEKGVQFT